MKGKIGNLYPGVRQVEDKFHKWSFLYYPLFLVQRLFFVMIPLIFLDRSGHQIQALLLINEFYLIFYCAIWPHTDQSRVRMEIFNASFQLVVCYHMIMFSDMVTELEFRVVMGTSFLFSLVCVMSVNLIVVTRDGFLTCRRTKKLANIKS